MVVILMAQAKGVQATDAFSSEVLAQMGEAFGQAIKLTLLAGKIMGDVRVSEEVCDGDCDKCEREYIEVHKMYVQSNRESALVEDIRKLSEKEGLKQVIDKALPGWNLDKDEEETDG